MRKSMIRIATIALAVVMLSTCAISAIFAGYSVSDTASVTATVSGFGITVDVAEATNANKTLVPGGSGTLLTVVANGTPVVAAGLTLDATVTMADDLPIVITVNGADVTKGEYETYAKAVEAAIEAVTKSYAQNAAVESATELTVGWKWTAGANDNTVTDGTTITVAVTATIAQS